MDYDMTCERSKKAMDLFAEGYNCAQAVTLAFADLLPYDEKALALMSSSFGGGIGRLREVCGTISGLALVTGILYGYDDPKANEEKKDHYARIQEMAKVFEEENGSIVCRELLGLSAKHDAPTPEARSDRYYQKRPCKELCGMSAAILDAYIKEHPYQ